MNQVPFFNYKIFNEQYGQAMLSTVSDVLERGAFIMQSDLFDFEKNIADYLGVKHAIGVANCTDGLEMALVAAGVKPGDEVILPSHTFIATAAAVKMVGGTPVLVECGPDHMIDPASIEKAITPKTKVIMPVQLNGRTCDMDKVMAIANKHHLAVVEDAAQALGSMFKGKKAGAFGLAAAFSFYPAKILGSLGDGGIVVTNDDEVARTVRMLRDHGRNEEGEIQIWGRNSRLDNIQAAILNCVFKDYERIVTRRREMAALYTSLLSSCKQVKLPPAPDSDSNHFDVYQNYEIEADKRDELKDFLKAHGIGTLVQWSGKMVHQHEALGFDVDLPFTEALSKKYIMLPMNMSLTNEDIKYVADKIIEFYQN